MTDMERILWAETIASSTDETECRDYWSEPLSPKNTHKRNDSYREECYAALWRGHKEVRNSDSWQYDQYARIANWLDISGGELLGLEISPLEIVENLLRSYENEGRYPNSKDDEWYGLLGSDGVWPDSPFEGIGFNVNKTNTAKPILARNTTRSYSQDAGYRSIPH